jgi:TRAP-type uncharacterized transport system substrate-binding protein
MLSVTKAARSMSVQSGLMGIVTPVHKGAIDFWTENGLTPNPAQMGK